MDNTNDVDPRVNNLLVVLTILYSFWANVFQHADLVLSIITKIIPIISFVFFLVINYKTIIANSKELWKKIPKRKRKKKNESQNN